jgi:hypothetical protein
VQNHPRKFIETWSSISQGDLGLKAAYWKDETKEEILFRPIVGWLSYSAVEAGKSDAPSTNGFVPVVIDDTWFPRSAWVLPNYVGVLLKEITAEDILERLKKAREAGTEETIQFTGRERGSA